VKLDVPVRFVRITHRVRCIIAGKWFTRGASAEKILTLR
jgi:hypothetical protein